MATEGVRKVELVWLAVAGLGLFDTGPPIPNE